MYDISSFICLRGPTLQYGIIGLLFFYRYMYPDTGLTYKNVKCLPDGAWFPKYVFVERKGNYTFLSYVNDIIKEHLIE